MTSFYTKGFTSMGSEENTTNAYLVFEANQIKSVSQAYWRIRNIFAVY